jgi:pimeloyl-ACP methyl ester carboxylesterase
MTDVANTPGTSRTQGNPVLLVHGFASSFHLNWEEPGLSYLLEDAGREVIGVDLLGHGEAPRPHDPAAYADMGARIVDVLPADGRRVDAVGFSMGARTLIEVVAAHPDRFGKLVLAGVGENLFMSGDKEPLAHAIETGDGGPGGVAALFVSFASGSGNDPKALAACMRRDEPPITEEQLARITSPTLVVLGDKDFVGSADRLVAALPNAQLKLLKNVEHFATPKDFGFIDATLEFLDAVPG